MKDKRLGLFSYGSGLASTLLSVTVVGDISPITKVLDFDYKLGEGRKIQSPEEYLAAIELREKAHLQKSFKPQGSLDNLSQGVYYLTEVDDKFRRNYAIKE